MRRISSSGIAERVSVQQRRSGWPTKKQTHGCNVELGSAADAQALLSALARDCHQATALFDATLGGRYVTWLAMVMVSVVPLAPPADRP